MMTPLYDSWGLIEKDLLTKDLVIFMDYDGTLTPIVEDPDQAVLGSEAKNILSHLTKTPDCQLVVISGRALEDVKNLVGVKHIIYIGNHGFEIEGPGIKFEGLVSHATKRVLDSLHSLLCDEIGSIEGVLIEDKGLTISVHYRQAQNSDIVEIKKIFQRIIQPYQMKKEIYVGEGKKILEIKPPIEWDKGKAALWVLNQRKHLHQGRNVMTVAIGDDATDEDMFSSLKDKGISVFVGQPKPSYAQYYLPSTVEVQMFLEKILELKDPSLKPRT